MIRKSGFGAERKRKDLLALGPKDLGQNCPQDYPHSDDLVIEAFVEPLGEPISIKEVARLIGVSVWTVRHRYLEAGLPHLRVGYSGKLLFYTNQIVRWLLWQQQRGGTNL